MDRTQTNVPTLAASDETAQEPGVPLKMIWPEDGRASGKLHAQTRLLLASVGVSAAGIAGAALLNYFSR